MLSLSTRIGQDPVRVGERTEWEVYHLAETFGDALRRFERQWAQYAAELESKARK